VYIYEDQHSYGDISMARRVTNAAILRAEAKELGFNHSNIWWRTYLADKYGRRITVQQIAAVLGRYEDRQVGDHTAVHEAARRLLLACRNDAGLAKRILREYVSGGQDG
jgi:hypothetical protein